VRLLVSELFIYQNARCNDKKKRKKLHTYFSPTSCFSIIICLRATVKRLIHKWRQNAS